MHRPAPRWLPATALALSCVGGPADRPAPMGVQIYSPQLALSRITSPIHLRIFPREDFACDASRGHVLRGGMRVTTGFGGGNVRPHVRCDAEMWRTREAEFGVARPVDLCFGVNEMREVEVAAGSYIVLVEGSGVFPGPGGSTTMGILGSGCAEVTVAAGQSQSLPIVLQEQTEIMGVCGDREVTANEMCDEGGMDTPTCTAQCRFPERVVPTTAGGLNKRRPSVAWAPNQRLVVAFDNGDDVFAHLFDPVGQPVTSPAALANDQVLDSTGASQQSHARVFATAAGWAGAWQSLERNARDFDIRAVAVPDYEPLQSPPDVMVNATSMAAGQSRRNVAVAVSGERVAWVFEDQATQTLRVASAPFGAPQQRPTEDVPLVAAGPAMSPATEARIAPVANGFVVVFTAGAPGSRDVYAARLDAMGAPMGAPVQVNTQGAGDQDQPAVAASGDDVVVAWRDASRTGADTDGTTIRWRHFSAALAPDGDERLAPTTVAGDQAAPTVAIGRAPRLLIAWQHGDGTIRGRMFSTAGDSLPNAVTGTSGDFDVNAPPDAAERGGGPRVNPSAAFGGQGRFAVAWEDQNSDGMMHASIRMTTLPE